MDRKLGRLALSIVLGISPVLGASQAQDLAPPTIGGLVSECRPISDFESKKPLSERERDGLLLCFGYFAGAAEAIATAKAAIYCVPDGVLVGQRVKIFLKWADENPDTLHMPRAYGVQLSMLKPFPC